MEYSEAELIIPALELLTKSPDGLGTTQISRLLRAKLEPSGDDLEILAGRSDDKFSQKVRNLTGSHKTLEKRGVAIREGDVFKLTAEGVRYLDQHAELHEAFVRQAFTLTEREKAANSDYENVLIEEGERIDVTTSVAKRSRKLTEFAREKFKDANGEIACQGCGFKGGEVYGEPGLGLIDIHHLSPLAISGEETSKLEEALDKVVPLCPNCHRLVHKKRDSLMPLDELKKITGHGVTKDTQAVSAPWYLKKPPGKV